MVVPNLLFDFILFGVLIVAAVLDFAVPSLHGFATLIAVGAFTYIAAQELCDLLLHRNLWTQESLATALALSLGGFIYFWWRNDSDLVMLGLSIGLMMASLMVAISIIGSFGAAIKEGSASPIAGIMLTIFGALVLGSLAGLLTLIQSPVSKLLAVGIGMVLWKLREKVRPPQPNALAQAGLAAGSEAPAAGSANVEAAVSPLHSRIMLAPQRGTLLDRFLPILVLGALLFLVFKQTDPPIGLPAAPAAADNKGPETRHREDGRLVQPPIEHS